MVRDPAWLSQQELRRDRSRKSRDPLLVGCSSPWTVFFYGPHRRGVRISRRLRQRQVDRPAGDGGLNPNYSGEIRIDGKLSAGPSEVILQRVQMVFQDPYGSLHPGKRYNRNSWNLA